MPAKSYLSTPDRLRDLDDLLKTLSRVPLTDPHFHNSLLRLLAFIHHKRRDRGKDWRNDPYDLNHHHFRAHTKQNRHINLWGDLFVAVRYFNWIEVRSELVRDLASSGAILTIKSDRQLAGNYPSTEFARLYRLREWAENLKDSQHGYLTGEEE